MSIEKNSFVLYMFQQDLDNMKKWVLQYPNKETGGDLFGLWSGEGDNAVIHVVLGPGRNCTHGDYHFYQDVDYLEKVGSLLTEDYMLGHIGEWHSHHQLQLDRPSEGDCSTIERNFPQGACGFFLMITNIICENEVSLSPYVFKEGSRRSRAGQVRVIADRSPFAMVIPISQRRNNGKEAEHKKGETEDERKQTTFVPEDVTPKTVEVRRREFSSNASNGRQKITGIGLERPEARPTGMPSEQKVSMSVDSDFQYFEEMNGDVIQNIYGGLLNLVGKVKITFKTIIMKEMNMEFGYKGRKMRLSFDTYFPSSVARLYVNDRYETFFSLWKKYDMDSYDFSKFLKEMQDYIQTKL